MAEDSDSNSPSRTRRSSFAGQTFAELFGTGRTSMSRSNDYNNSPPNQFPGPITSAAAQAQRRRLSLSTMGINNSNAQPSSLGSLRARNDSLGSASESIDECAVEDDQGVKDSPTPATPFARRASFGARAMMDIKNGNGQSPNQSNGTSSPASFSSGGSAGGSNSGVVRAPSVGTISARDVKGRVSGEGFNWSDNLRTRAERTSNAGLPAAAGAIPVHQRAKSVAIMEPPIREAPREQKRPDHFQERILKGDFYMD